MIDERSGVWVPDEGETWETAYLLPAPWNPNKQPAKTFRRLIASIKEDGFLEPIVTAPVPPDTWREYVPEMSAWEYEEAPERFRLIVGGKHRWDAAQVLGMERVPVIHKEGVDEDWIKFRNMSLNMLKGEIDPEKFMALWEEMAAKGYEEEVLQYQMGIAEQKQFKALVKDAKQQLPTPELQERFEEVEDQIQSVDDLERILNELLSKHGDTLPFDYMLFEYSGRTVAWIKMGEVAFRGLTDLTSWAYEAQVPLSRVFDHLFSGVTLAEARQRAEEEAAEEQVDFS